MEPVVLNRLEITGRLDNHTPLVVITEIADCQLIKYDLGQLGDYRYVNSIIDLINKKEVGVVKPPYSGKKAKAVGNYVNPNTEWQPISLENSFHFLRRYTGSYNLPEEFSIGSQTPQNPYSLNSCVLYRLCRHYQINVNRTTSLEQMGNAIRLYTGPINSISHLIRQQLETPLSDQKSRLINMLMMAMNLEDVEPENLARTASAETSPLEEVLDNARMEEIYRLFDDTRRVYSRINPRNNNEAVVFAAKGYGIDLTHFAQPLLEFPGLVQIPFMPRDPVIRKVVGRNSLYLSLRHNFNPLLPVALYSPENISYLAEREGYSSEEGMDRLEFLNLNYAMETFYEGYQRGIKNTATLISYEEVDDLDNSQIVCFGSRMDQSYDAFTYDELADWFRHIRAFVHPTQRETSFSPTAMRKLKILCSAIRPVEFPESANSRRKLLLSIQETEIFTSESNVTVRNFHQRYLEATPELKIQIRQTVILLFHLSLYMRGWNGTGPHPISRAPDPTGTVRYNQVTTEIAVKIVEFKLACEGLGPIGELILGLPLCRYEGGKYVASNLAGDGLTIRDRLIIVSNGESIPNMASCVRLSSNWLATSSHRYGLLLQMEPFFNIANLANTY